MVTCELDRDVSGEILGWKLPAWKALLFHKVIPSCGGLLVYLTLICFDFALVYEHYKNGDDGLMAFCLILMTLPALISLVFTLAAPPPGLQTDLTAFNVNMQKKEIRWIVMQFVNTIFFPIAAIGRYCSQIFWWVEAVCASRDEDEERTNEALHEARRTSPIELYLFLQAFIHCAPHAILNILDLMAKLSTSTFDKISVQSVSIVASSLRMASTATMYRRFEREKLCGRNYPWRKSYKEADILVTDRVISNTVKNDETDNVYEPIQKRLSKYSTQSSEDKNRVDSDMIQFSPRTTAAYSDSKNRADSDLMKFSPRTTANSDDKNKVDSDLVNFSPRSSTFYDDAYHSDIESDTSSDYLPPMSPKQDAGSGFDSDSEYIRPLSIIDKVAPRRRDTEYNIEKVNITPPPVIPAPRPMSLAVWAEKLVENAESIPMWLSAPQRSKYYREVVQDEPDLPRRVPRSYMRGLEPQDATAALVHYLGWYMFFIARLISIACFINFFPFLAIIILFSHYQVMLLFLIIPQASSLKRGFYIFLAFIYLFCLMEFKIRFRHVRVWHVFWIIVCTIETVVFTGLWASINNSADTWWKWFVTNVILGSLILSYVCFTVYFVLLKPRETIVYIRNKNNSTK